MEIKKSVVLLSGGLDSTTLTYYLEKEGRKVYPVIFYYKQKHDREVQAALATCSKLNLPCEVINLDVLSRLAPSALTRDSIAIPEGHYEAESMKATVVPNRNMVFLSLATSYAIGIGAEEVAYAAHSGDHTIYPDCRPEFIDRMSEAISLCDDSKISLVTPFKSFSKKEILELGLGLGVDYSLTWSCYKGRRKACGKCGTCIERLEAFKALGEEDPLEYE